MRLRGSKVDPARLVALERAETIDDRRTHALVLDVSGSMDGDIEGLRAAARAYVDQLRPGRDRAMVFAFDESVRLLQAATADRALLHQAIDRVHLGGFTSMYDALGAAFASLDDAADRHVVVLLTDGDDSSSLLDGSKVLEGLAARERLVVFPVGLKLRPIGSRGRSATPKTFLGRLAQRTGGETMWVHDAVSVRDRFDRILRRLNDEALVTVLDDGADADQPARLDVDAPGSGCRIRVLERHPSRREQARPTSPQPKWLGDRWVWPAPQDARVALSGHRRKLPQGCVPAGEDPALQAIAWTGDATELSGCVLDFAISGGLLYEASTVERASFRSPPRTAWRSIAIPIEGALPVYRRPVEWMDRLARETRVRPAVASWTDPLKQPADRHARPFLDHPRLVSGRGFVELLAGLAPALSRSRWGDWARQRFRSDQAATRRRRLERLLGALPPDQRSAVAPSLGQPVVNQAVSAAMFDAQARSLRPYLTAWLGDIEASTLFRHWEQWRIERWFDGEAGALELEEDWTALYRQFFVASYAREIGVLYPTYDAAEDRIGFWRVLLPKPSWYLRRIQNWKRYADLPLDLLPERPIAADLLRLLEQDFPEAADALRRNYRLAHLTYRLRGKPRRWKPDQAFAQVALEFRFVSRDGSREALDWTVSYDRDRPGEARSSWMELAVRLSGE